MMLARSTCILATLVLWAAAGSPSGPGPSRAVVHRTAYVVAVGIDHYQRNRLSAGVSDARKFARRIQAERCDSACRATPLLESRRVGVDSVRPEHNRELDSVVVTLITDSAATLDAVDRGFNEIVKRARKDDVVIFFFAGMSIYNRDSAGKPNVQLCTIDASCNEPSDYTTGGSRRDGITATRLRRWMESTSAERQLLVLDACSHPDYAVDLISGLTPSDPTVAGLTSRNRVVISSLTLAFERPDIGGVLTHIVSGTSELLTDAPFQPPGGARLRWERDLRVREAKVAADTRGDPELGIFFERDFLRLVSAAQVSGALGSSRGVEPDPPAAARKRKAAGDAYALVVGTDKYRAGSGWRQLANPVSDARAIAAELHDHYDFQVTTLENPTLAQLHGALRAVQKRTYGENDRVFIFLAGHGYCDSSMDQGFLVPTDASALATDDGRRTYLPFSLIEGYVNKIPAKHILIALDACFGGTFAQRLSDGGSRGNESEYQNATRDELIERALKYESRLYLASGGKEYVPDGRPGHHSPFASRLLETLRTGGGATRVLTLLDLRASLEKLGPPVPQPRAGGFGDNEPGGNFVFVER